ncbi:hypothetical protein GEMRC1_003904 [Eukaryota sp. GEM-RC1]
MESLYHQSQWRKWSYWKSVYKEKSERKILHRFRQVYGDPTNTWLAIGDWSQSRHRKYKPPSMGKGSRKLFKKAGYQVLLVNEFRTSLQCHGCSENNDDEGETETFLKVKDPNFRKKKRRVEKKANRLSALMNWSSWTDEDDKLLWQEEPDEVKCWGLVRCKKCHKLWNRDFNSCLNILKIVECTLAGEDRPMCFSDKLAEERRKRSVKTTNNNEDSITETVADPQGIEPPQPMCTVSVDECP